MFKGKRWIREDRIFGSMILKGGNMMTVRNLKQVSCIIKV